MSIPARPLPDKSGEAPPLRTRSWERPPHPNIEAASSWSGAGFARRDRWILRSKLRMSWGKRLGMMQGKRLRIASAFLRWHRPEACANRRDTCSTEISAGVPWDFLTPLPVERPPGLATPGPRGHAEPVGRATAESGGESSGEVRGTGGGRSQPTSGDPIGAFSSSRRESRKPLQLLALLGQLEKLLST